MLKTKDTQDIMNTPMADDIKLTIKNLYLFVPNSVETQLMFNEATQTNYEISYVEYYAERRVISDMIVQHYIGLAQQVNSPNYLIIAHQTKDRTSALDEKINIALFDNLYLRKYHVQKDSLRYPRDSLLQNYEENDYFEQYKNKKFYFKD